METMKGFIEFLNSYPLWAKLLAFAGLLITACTLIFVPRISGEKGSDPEKSTRVYLMIEGASLYPANEDEQVQIYAFINGTEYRYPSVAGVEWLQVGPTMSPGIFEIPDSDIYEVRFEGNMRRRDYGSRHLASQQVITVTTLPYSGKYSLHQVDEGVRSAGISASLRFSLEKK